MKTVSAPMVPQVSQWLTISDVVARTKFSRTTVYSFINSGKLKSQKVGYARRVSEQALAEFMARFDGAGEIEAGE